jgi:uncharacterized membrane protein YkvI
MPLNKSIKRLITSSKVSFAYVGTVVGAGFASGQEVLRFFTVYGAYSIWAIFFSTLLFIWIGTRIMQLGHKLEARSFDGVIRSVFGSVAPAVEVYLIIALVSIAAAMLAGTGVLLEENIGIPFWAGAVITAIFAIIIVVNGVKGILTVNTFIVPLIIVFSILIFIYTISNQNNVILDIEYLKATPFELLKTGVLYASLNLILSIGVLATVGSEVGEPQILVYGGVGGGILLGAMLLISDYCLKVHSPEIYDLEIPVLYIVHQMGRGFSLFYTIIVWGEIFTTLISNLFSITSIACEKLRLPVLVISVLVLLSGLLLASLGFSNIVSWMYPLLGFIGMFLVAALIIKRSP